MPYKNMEITEPVKSQFNHILREKRIDSVYQPIVSLKDGTIEGYEALSRINLPDCMFNVEEMFRISEELGKVWELEELCRKHSIENAMEKPHGKKLFLNVDPKVIRDGQFREGMTCKYLRQYGLKPEDIIFEITERTSIQDEEAFLKIIEHYRRQNFQIAIDDFGNGYAGLNRVCALSTEYVKIDIGVVREIDQDKLKQALVESFVIFCNNAGIKLIAEGIETLGQLKELIRLGVDYGQGYYIQRPVKQMYDIPQVVKTEIRKYNLSCNQFVYQPSFWDQISTITHKKPAVNGNDSAEQIYYLFKESKELTEICVVDNDEKILGMLTRNHILEVFGGRYGFNLHLRDTVDKIMNPDAMIVDGETSIEVVSKMALARTAEYRYDAVVVSERGKYLGVVTVKDLLETAISIQVSRAMEANPLTGLPGNSVIQEKIAEVVEAKGEYAFVSVKL